MFGTTVSQRTKLPSDITGSRSVNRRSGILLIDLFLLYRIRRIILQYQFFSFWGESRSQFVCFNDILAAKEHKEKGNFSGGYD
jgi:hypothetical protein